MNFFGILRKNGGFDVGVDGKLLRGPHLHPTRYSSLVQREMLFFGLQAFVS